MTFALTLGRGLGYTAALAGHAVCSTSTASANFAVDVATGATAGYVDHSERLALARAARDAKRPASLAIAMAMPPALAAKIAAKAKA